MLPSTPLDAALRCLSQLTVAGVAVFPCARVAFLPDLAMSLNNLGGYLSNLGGREEALGGRGLSGAGQGPARVPALPGSEPEQQRLLAPPDRTGVDHVIGFAQEVNAASRRVLEKVPGHAWSSRQH